MLNVILGGVGQGKSYLGRYLALTKTPSIIVDPIAEHTGDVICQSYDDFLSLFEGGAPLGPSPVVVVRRIEDVEKHADDLFTLLAEFRGWHIFIDEVDKFCNPKMIPRPLEDLVNYRRHYGIGLTVVARRAAKIHKDLTSLASAVCLFKIHGRVDLDFVKSEVGEEYAEACRKLDERQYIRVQIHKKDGLS